jgi:hypothetical protein
MAYAATAEGSLSSATAAPGVLALQRALVWLAGASVAIVFIEPSPYELVTLAAIVIFFATGLRLRLVFVPLLLLLFLINIGYSISAASLMDKPEVTNWIATSWYMTMTVIFLAMVVAEDTAARLDMLRRSLIVGGLIAATAGIAGYFNLVPGGHDLLTLYGRARGTYKDPNVLGAFLILPALLALQSVVADSFGKALRSAIALGIMALALLLAFSRAAWGGLAITSVFMLALMVLTSRSHKQRSRIIVMAVVAAIVVVMLVAVLLSFDSISDMFKQRASFDQSYDEGRFGRFGRHILGAEMALDLPFGIGPLQFHKYFPEDTHNRHRPLAALLDDAGHDVGHVRRRAARQGDVRRDQCCAPILASRFSAGLRLNVEPQTSVIDKPLDQSIPHGGTGSPDAAWDFRRVAQQADRAFPDHL